MPDAIAKTSIVLMSRDGPALIPTYSGIGNLGRPFAAPQEGGRTATLETYYDYFINDVPNPDEALALDPNFALKLRQDPDVAPAIRKRTVTVAGYPVRIEANPDAPDQETAKIIAKAVSRMWNALEETERIFLIENCQEAIMSGSQGFECLWNKEATGLYRPVKINPVHPSRFSFDVLGNIALKTRNAPIWGVYLTPGQENIGLNQMQGPNGAPPFSAGRFLYYMYRRGQGTWNHPEQEGYSYWGIGEDVSLYYLCMFDMFVIRLRMKFLEMYGLGRWNMYFPNNNAFTKETIRIGNSARGETVRAIPRVPGDAFDGLYKLELAAMPTPSFDMFQQYAEYKKVRIWELICGRSDEGGKGGTGSAKGGYSEELGRQDAGPAMFYALDARKISAFLTAQLIAPMTLQQFPNAQREYWPILRLGAKEERNRQAAIEGLKLANEAVPVTQRQYMIEGDILEAQGDEPVVNPPAQEERDPFDSIKQGLRGEATTGGALNQPERHDAIGAGTGGNGQDHGRSNRVDEE